MSDDGFDRLLEEIAAAPDVPLPDSTSLAPGDRVGPYEVLRPLGRGGMGEVYLARDTKLLREVALKVIRPSALAGDGAERFLREARITARFNHPNIVTIHDVGEQDGVPYVALEALEGETLRARMDAGPLPLAEALDAARAVARALAEAHGHGVLHRDLKPANVFVPSTGPLRVLDFGLAKLAGRPTDAAPGPDAGEASPFETRDAGVRGTPAYMAPEQWSGGDAGPATDVWAFGVLTYELLARVHPFAGAGSILERVCGPDPAPAVADRCPALPEPLARMVDACLDKDPARRPDASTIVRALEGEAPETPGDPPPWWKAGLWFLLTLPLAWALWPATRALPGVVLSALGLPRTLPPGVEVTVVVALCVAQTGVAIRLALAWRRGRSTWLHGPWFTAVPATGLLLVLWHALTLAGQRQAHQLALSGYPALTAEQAGRMSALISDGYSAFLGAASVDLLLVSILAFMVLLAHAFRASSRGRPPRRHAVALTLGVAVVVLAETVLLPETLSFLGVWRFVLYATWALTVVAVWRGGPATAWSRLRAGAVASFALVGLELALGFTMAFRWVEGAPGETRAWLFQTEASPAMVLGAAAQLGVLACLFGIVAAAIGRPRITRGVRAWHLTLLLVTAAPAALLFATMASVGDLWLSSKLATMTPVSVTAGAPPSVYVDARPRGAGPVPEAAAATTACVRLGLRRPTDEEWAAALRTGGVSPDARRGFHCAFSFPPTP